jgi:hypothetical protein
MSDRVSSEIDLVKGSISPIKYHLYSGNAFVNLLDSTAELRYRFPKEDVRLGYITEFGSYIVSYDSTYEGVIGPHRYNDKFSVIWTSEAPVILSTLTGGFISAVIVADLSASTAIIYGSWHKFYKFETDASYEGRPINYPRVSFGDHLFGTTFTKELCGSSIVDPVSGSSVQVSCTPGRSYAKLLQPAVDTETLVGICRSVVREAQLFTQGRLF